jgi:hypothetical protein
MGEALTIPPSTGTPSLRKVPVNSTDAIDQMLIDGQDVAIDIAH